MMAVNFNIVIPVETLIEKTADLWEKYEISIWVEYYDKKKRWHTKYDYTDITKNFLSDNNYVQFFLTTKKVRITEKESTIETEYINFYNEDLFSHTIEGNGGRENTEHIEAIRLRMLAKKPDEKIQKFYSALQNKLKKDPEVKAGLRIGNHFDKKIYYLPGNKRMWYSLEEERFEYFSE